MGSIRQHLQVQFVFGESKIKNFFFSINEKKNPKYAIKHTFPTSTDSNSNSSDSGSNSSGSTDSSSSNDEDDHEKTRIDRDEEVKNSSKERNLNPMLSLVQKAQCGLNLSKVLSQTSLISHRKKVNVTNQQQHKHSFTLSSRTTK